MGSSAPAVHVHDRHAERLGVQSAARVVLRALPLGPRRVRGRAVGEQDQRQRFALYVVVEVPAPGVEADGDANLPEGRLDGAWKVTPPEHGGLAFGLRDDPAHAVRPGDQVAVVEVSALLVQIADANEGVVFFCGSYRPLGCVPAAIIGVLPDGLAGHVAAQRQLRQHDEVWLGQPGDQPFDIGLSLLDALDVVVQFEGEYAHGRATSFAVFLISIP